AGQYHHHSAAAEVPRAQPGRERLAVHARQLALQPHLQILRRSRRPLLCGMEQARRSALAHHVHRTAPMGPRVLINGIWYEAAARVLKRLKATDETAQRDASRLGSALPKIFQAAYRPNPNFTGRFEALDSLQRSLRTGTNAAVTAVAGMGG